MIDMHKQQDFQIKEKGEKIASDIPVLMPSSREHITNVNSNWGEKQSLSD